MSTTIYTLNIDNYAPKICKLTYPLIRAYAEKLDAKFIIMCMRDYPQQPITLEKFQLKRIANAYNDNWSIFIDSDCLVHPDMPDVTKMLRPDTVAMYGFDQAYTRFKDNIYFQRDGRYLSSCGWFVVSSHLTRNDLYELPKRNINKLISDISLTNSEKSHTTPEHLIDEYILSMNIARYGLKTVSLIANFHQFLFHYYNASWPAKEQLIKDQLIKWGL